MRPSHERMLTGMCLLTQQTLIARAGGRDQDTTINMKIDPDHMSGVMHDEQMVKGNTGPKCKGPLGKTSAAGVRQLQVGSSKQAIVSYSKL